MEWLIGFLIVWGVSWLIYKSAGGGGQNGGDAPGVKPFSLSVSREVFKEFDCFVPRIAGSLFFPHDHCAHRIHLRLSDITDDADGEPVLCEIAQLQAEDSPIFSFTTSPQISLHRAVSFREDARLPPIPIRALRFPRTGRRTLEFRAIVTTGEMIITSAKCKSFLVESKEPGYLGEHQEFGRLKVQLAVAIAGADGEVHPNERGLIRTWIRKFSATSNEDERDDAYERLWQIFMDAAISPPDDSQAAALARRAREVLSESACFGILELCVKVAGIDDEAHKSEMRILKIIASELGIDIDRFRSLTDRHLPPPSEDEINLEDEIGITPGMSPEKIKKHLLREYGKWNSRVTHHDSKVRERAKLMCNLIAEARKKHCRDGN